MNYAEAVEWRNVLKRDPCAYCGGTSTTIDHVYPRILGGKEDETNEVGACKRCNSRKNSKSLLAFLSAQRVGADRAHRTHIDCEFVEAHDIKLAHEVRQRILKRQQRLQQQRDAIERGREIDFRLAYRRKWGRFPTNRGPLP